MFSGSTCKQGEIEAVVIATGVHTFFGKAAHLVDSTNQVGHFQKVTIQWTISILHFLLSLYSLLIFVIQSENLLHVIGAPDFWYHDHVNVSKVLTAIGNFCICSIAIGIIIEIIVMYPIQRRAYRDGINNLLVLLIGGIPIAMPTVLSVTMAIGSHRLSQQVKRFFGSMLLLQMGWY